MRGKMAEFQSLLRKEAPHLLDIDGDTCHHVHNASKNFLSPFNKHIEQLLTDLRTDMEWSTDLREYLKEICSLLSTPYSMPAARVDHSWLSSYLSIYRILILIYLCFLVNSVWCEISPV